MKKLSSVLIALGIFLIVLALGLLVIIFYPVITNEVNYQISQIQPVKKDIIPKDSEFGIVVPKIGANSKIVPDVDPNNSIEYQYALTKGVAHARGTVFPGEEGNIFLFSHSSVNFYEASKFNSIFYLLDKMEKGDSIDLYFKGKKYSYKVTDKKIVPSSDIKYLSGRGVGKTVTLMTCWPAGTSWKRLLVFAELDPNYAN